MSSMLSNRFIPSIAPLEALKTCLFVFFLSFKTNPFTLCDNTARQQRDEPPPSPSHLSEVDVAN